MRYTQNYNLKENEAPNEYNCENANYNYEALDGIIKGISDVANAAATLAQLLEHINDATPHVSNADRINWNNKPNNTTATQTANGLMSAQDKTKLDGVQAGAQANSVLSVAGKTGNVVLSPADAQLGNVINSRQVVRAIHADQDSQTLEVVYHLLDQVITFVGDNNPDGSPNWFSVARDEIATQQKRGLMSPNDKQRVDNSVQVGDSLEIKGAEGSNFGGFIDFHYNNTTDDFSARIVDFGANGLNLLNNLGGIYANGQRIDAPATTSNNGLMSAQDKTKLDAVYNYIHAQGWA